MWGVDCTYRSHELDKAEGRVGGTQRGSLRENREKESVDDNHHSEHGEAPVWHFCLDYWRFWNYGSWRAFPLKSYNTWTHRSPLN